MLFFLFKLYNVAINSYFSQDDFFHLRIIMDKNITDIPDFFTSRLEGQTFYRPISRETYNLIMYKLFDLNPLSYHLVNLFLILTNAIFLILITKKLDKTFLTVFLSTFIFLVSSVHSIELYYLSSIQTLLSTSLVLVSILFYIVYINFRHINYFLASLLAFSVALLCHESAIILPGFILILEAFYGGKFNVKSLAFKLIPYFILMIIFLISTTSITSLPSQKVYQPNFNIKSILNTFGWYIAWSVGFPEMLVDFVKPGLKLKTEFMIWYKDYARIIFPIIFIYSAVLFLLFFQLRETLIKNKFLIFSVLAFVISLLPFLFFPQHKFVYYLSLGSIWFSAIFGTILSTAWRYSLIHKALVSLVILFLVLVSNRTTEINAKTYWAAKRAAAAKAILENFKKSYPNANKDTIFYIVDDPSYPDIAKEWGTSSQQVFYILSGSDALKLLYNKPSIKVYYEGSGGLPNNADKSKVITIMAKFPY